MLVFLSDIHWTDGTSGETIHSGAFRGFVQDLSRMAKDARAKDLEVVLLGDILDLIRSEQWIKTEVRPWDAKSPKQEQITKKILHRTIYFNTGTWRKVHVLTRFDPKQREFIGWHVLSFVCFYRAKENSNHLFEVWHGALGTAT